MLYILLIGLVSACAQDGNLPPAPMSADVEAPTYVIGPGDRINVFVWQNVDLSRTVPVRADGRISVPLIGDIQAAGRTPELLAADIAMQLERLIVDPQVTVIVEDTEQGLAQRVTVVGEAANPQAVSYQIDMSMLDVMVAVGGLTEFADGNHARLIRTIGGEAAEYRLRLTDLIEGGDMSANVKVYPGDVVVIPEGIL